MKKVLIFGGIAVVLIVISYFGYKAYKAKSGAATATTGATTTPTAQSTSGKPVLLRPTPLPSGAVQQTVNARA